MEFNDETIDLQQLAEQSIEANANYAIALELNINSCKSDSRHLVRWR